MKLRAALASLLLAGCGCEGRAFTVRRAGAAVAEGCAEVADTAAARSAGLIGRDPLPAESALWLQFPMVTEGCIVNRGVTFAIDVAYVAPDGRVTAVEHAFPAGDPVARCHDGVQHVVEWSAANAPDLRVGDTLVW